MKIQPRIKTLKGIIQIEARRLDELEIEAWRLCRQHRVNPYEVNLDLYGVTEEGAGGKAALGWR